MIINKNISIDKGYRFDDFKKTELYDGQEDNRFFWINELCHIKGVNAMLKIGLWFENGEIRQIQLFCTDGDITDEEVRKNKHQQILDDELFNIDLHAKKIINYWDKRDLYSSIIIDL